MAAAPAVAFFSVWDYMVFALMLLVSAAIGIYYALTGTGQRSSRDFLTGGRGMTAVPVALSLSASFMSAITVLATPSEVYRYGAIFGVYAVSYALVVAVCSEVFLPVFYRLGITSTYEYLELRFNRVTRLCGTVLFIIQTVLYTGAVIYAPALALNQVTGFHLWGAVISTGVVCTFYCTLGGLKAVVWTDVFQVGIMVAGFLSVIIRSSVLQGGFSTIINDSAHGGRLNFWDFDPSPLRRHTFWTITFGGAFVWIGLYGVNQAQVQRYISCKSLSHAKMSLLVNLVGLWAILFCSVFCGLCLYSIYKHCDPWTAGMVSAPDQLMPYLVLDILRDFPGLPGLFVAAAYSGTLSTVSSSINALAAVTVEDLIKPYFSMSEKKLSWTSKGLSLLYGAVCIGMAGLASMMGGLIQAVVSIFGVIGGPLLGLFALGILCPFANATGGLAGLLTGFALSLWVGIGAQVYPPLPQKSRPLALTTAGCNFTLTETVLNMTVGPTEVPLLTTVLQEATSYRSFLADYWYSVSYLYFSPIGTLTAITVGLSVSLLTGGKKLKLEPGLTLRKEDLTCYLIYNFFKKKAMTRARRQNPVANGKRDLGTNNAAFCDMELDLSEPRSNISRP
ncbi:sodium-coupled monocarboxylate transporter 1 [Megalops cyprinoides]|uniref:sodium-coupled monocarboxylate transporter 1 n=1 Tax=Megalops cyprinoides TaxID=118141 RepID=UPI001864F493|nr:sodium-coupled monocarboxylate transporter 1 [Megalops cyprinoides]